MSADARVTYAEANVLSLSRWVLDDASTVDGNRLLLSPSSAPATLGPTSAALLGDSLIKGTALALARGGGWTAGPTGRLWERPLPPLAFSSRIVQLCQWALKLPLVELEVAPLAVDGVWTPAEEVFIALLLWRARGAAAETTLCSQARLREAPLVQLMHAALLAQVAPLTVAPLTAAHLPFVRGLLDVLGDAWLEAEERKRTIARPKVLAEMGRAQTAVAESFLSVVDGLGQREVAGFFVDAGAAWLAQPRTAKDLVALDPETPARDRAEARNQAGAFLRVLGRLERWDQEHRTTHFIDDGYQLAQALVKDWERLSPAGFEAARRLVAELTALPG